VFIIPRKASATWFPVFVLDVAAMVNDVPASVHALRFSTAFLGGLDTFLADALTAADAVLVLAYGQLVFYINTEHLDL
jgi:hypothetical protein